MNTPRAMTPHDPALSPGDEQLLHHLRKQRRVRREGTTRPEAARRATTGQRVADLVARTVGSWRFIIIQSVLITIWITWNLSQGTGALDPYPFILLNLLLSFQAAYTAPAIMMSQNRQAEIDRSHAENDYEVNVKAELEIELLHQKIDLLREKEIKALIDLVGELSRQGQSRAGD